MFRLLAATAEDQLGAAERLGRAVAAEDMHAPEHRRGAHRRQHAADPGFEFEQHRERVVRIGRRLVDDQLSLHAANRPGHMHQRVEHVNAGAGQAAGR